MTEARNMTKWIWGLVSAILLVVVAAHAVAPVPADHGRNRGSAFSASTAEVSLKSGARAVIAKDLVRLDPLGPAAGVAPVAVRPAAAALEVDYDGDRAAHWLPAESRVGPVGPRAPPLA